MRMIKTVAWFGYLLKIIIQRGNNNNSNNNNKLLINAYLRVLKSWKMFDGA